MEILDFIKQYNLTVNTTARMNISLPVFCVFIEDTEVVDGCILSSESGNANTIDESLSILCSKLSNKKLKIKDDYVLVGQLEHTKMLNR